MKKSLHTLMLIALTAGASFAQTGKQLNPQGSVQMDPGASSAKANYINNQDYLSASSLQSFKGFSDDSLKGFDEVTLKARLLGSHVVGQEYFSFMTNAKRAFINQKYHLGAQANSNSRPLAPGASQLNSHGNNYGNRPIGGNNTINTLPCINEGFESSAVGAYTGAANATAIQGWTLSSYTAGGSCGVTNWTLGAPEAWIVATPVFGVPGMSTLPNSPLGGTKVLHLNDYSPTGLQEKIVQTFPVTSANTLFQFAYAGAWEDGGHNCCEQPALHIAMYDCNGAPLTCSSLSLNASGPACPSGAPGYTVASSISWTSWQVKYIDLTPFVGTCVTIEIINGDCIFGGHFGSLFLDAQCGGQVIGVGLGGTGGPIPGPVSYCAGAGQAVLAAPLGYASYQWISPITGTIPAYLGGTAPTYTVTNPGPGSVYTVNLVTGSGCFFTSTMTIQSSTVSILAIGSSSTCTGGGASGTATVVGSGSGSGYTYSWINSSGASVGTTSMITGLAAGIYSVTISGLGAAGCGQATATVQVGVTPTPTTALLKPWCGSTAYLAAPLAGSAFQWYSNNLPIGPSVGGTLSSYVVTNPCNNCQYWLAYNSVQGCRDSIQFTLIQGSQGAISVPGPGTVCPSGTNGTPTIVVSPAPGSPSGLNGYTVTSVTAPSYSYGASGLNTTTFNPTGLAAGSYSVRAFDGSCYYSTTFNVSTLLFDFTVTPQTATLCSGTSTIANMNFAQPPQMFQYIYNWTPATYLSGTSQTTAIMSPVVPPGVISTVIYTVTATATLAMCPVTHTMALTVINPTIPVISTVPNVCNTHAPFSITVTPSGGTFVGTAVSSSGVLSPGLATPGASNTFTYTYAVNICSVSSAGTFTISKYNTAALVTPTIPALCVTDSPFNLMNIVQNTVTGVWTGTNVTNGVFNPAGLNTNTYSLTYSTSSTPFNVCGETSTLAVSVTKTLTPDITLVGPYCTNHAPVTMSVLPVGGNWSGSGMSAAGVLTPGSLGAGLQVYTYNVTVGACLNTGTTTVDISQFNSTALSGGVPDLCVSGSPFDLSTLIPAATTNAVWTGAGVAVGTHSLSPNGLSGSYVYVVTAASTPTSSSYPNGLCPDTHTLSVNIVNPVAPNITQPNPQCSIGSAFQLSVSPATGSWIPSQYVNASGIFTPSAAIIGNNIVQYVIGTSTCNIIQSKYVSVEAFVSAATTTSLLPDKCTTSAIVNLMPFSMNTAGTWSGPGVIGTSFNPATAGQGNFNLVYSTASSPSGLCPDQSTVAVHVYSLQVPVLSQIGPLCNSASPVMIQATPVGGLFGGINSIAINQQGLFTPGIAIEGNNIISYSITSGPCVAYAQTTVAVEKVISAALAGYPKPSYCKNNPIALNLNQFVQNPGGSWSSNGPSLNGNLFTFANGNVGNNNLFEYTTHSHPTGICTDTSFLRITIEDVPPLNILNNTASSGCAPLTISLDRPNTNTGFDTWDVGDGSTPISGMNNGHLDYTFNTPGTYSIVLTHSASCTSQATLAPIVVYDSPKANFSVPDEVSISNPMVQLTNLSVGNNSYQWKIGTLYTINGIAPNFSVPAVPGKYSITLKATSVDGCTSELTKFLEVKNEFNVFIPSSFTPNFDGLNDAFMPRFTPYGLDERSYDFEIFDRWGSLLFRTTDPTKGWDGSIQNKGIEAMKEDVYVYKLKYKDMDGNVYNKIGHVTLIK